MWFSNGGTNGSVHIDATENILCMVRGRKVFTMLDPAKSGFKVSTRVREIREETGQGTPVCTAGCLFGKESKGSC